MIIFHDIQQKTDEWFLLKKQRPLSSSNANTISVCGKGLETLCIESVAEMFSSGKKEQLKSVHIERGIELEPEARSIYEFETGNTVKEIGFITNDEISAYTGSSPDGLVGDDGLVEIKCKCDKLYFLMLLEKKETGTFDIEKDHHAQMQHQMLLSCRKWCDYVVYNPNYEEALLVQRVERDEAFIEKITVGILKGEKIIKELLTKFNKI